MSGLHHATVAHSQRVRHLQLRNGRVDGVGDASGAGESGAETPQQRQRQQETGQRCAPQQKSVTQRIPLGRYATSSCVQRYSRRHRLSPR